MRRTAPHLAVVAACALMACAHTAIRPPRMTDVALTGTLGGVPLQPGSAAALERAMEELQSRGALTSFALTGHRLLTRGWIEGDFTEIEIVYREVFDGTTAILATPRTDAGLVDAGLLHGREARFLGTMGNGFLYRSLVAQRSLLLDVGPADPAPPRVLKVVWTDRPAETMAGVLRMSMPEKASAPPSPPALIPEIRSLESPKLPATVSREELEQEAERAELEGRLATAASLWRSPPLADAPKAEVLESRLKRACLARLKLAGALSLETGTEGDFVEVVVDTPEVRLTPVYSRETRTSTYQGEIRRTERLSLETQQRLTMIDDRLRALEQPGALVVEGGPPLEEEKRALIEERTRLGHASTSKSETGERTHHYTASMQQWRAAIRMKALAPSGEPISLTAEYRSPALARVAADPTHHVKAMDEWIDATEVRKVALALGKEKLVEHLRRTLLRTRERECLMANAASAKGSEVEKQREAELRAALTAPSDARYSSTMQ